MNGTTPASRFADIPVRVFLDSSTLQVMLTYGGFLYENEALARNDAVGRDPHGIAKLEALRSIVQVAERAPFEFAVSERSVAEVNAAGDRRYLQWAYDVLDHWLSFDADELRLPPPVRSALDDRKFGYLGAGDRGLLNDAIALGCQAFLTMENRLPKNARHIQANSGLQVLTPIEMWAMLAPWAPLFR